MTTKHLNRKIRVLRLLAIIQTYHHYTMMQLNRQLLFRVPFDNRINQAEALRFYNYPYEALEEALSNAVYHKGYDLGNPIEVQIFMKNNGAPQPTRQKIAVLSSPSVANSVAFFAHKKSNHYGVLFADLYGFA